MREVVIKCDFCGGEVDRLYTSLLFRSRGKRVSLYLKGADLCKTCLQKLFIQARKAVREGKATSTF